MPTGIVVNLPGFPVYTKAFRSVSGSMWKDGLWQTKAEPVTAGHSQVKPGTYRFCRIPFGNTSRETILFDIAQMRKYARRITKEPKLLLASRHANPPSPQYSTV